MHPIIFLIKSIKIIHENWVFKIEKTQVNTGFHAIYPLFQPLIQRDSFRQSLSLIQHKYYNMYKAKPAEQSKKIAERSRSEELQQSLK